MHSVWHFEYKITKIVFCERCGMWAHNEYQVQVFRRRKCAEQSRLATEGHFFNVDKSYDEREVWLAGAIGYMTVRTVRCEKCDQQAGYLRFQLEGSSFGLFMPYGENHLTGSCRQLAMRKALG